MNEYKKFGYYYDEVMQKLEYDLWVEFVEPYLKKEDKILDLACGTGTFITMLKLKGFDVCGLDLSSSIIEIAKEKAKINHLQIPFYVMDMVDFKLDNKFNVITCFFDSINFLNNKNKIKQMLNNIYNHLEDNGYFICDIFSKVLLEEYDGSSLCEDYYNFKIDWKTKKSSPTSLKHIIKIIEDDQEIVESYNEYYYEIKDLLNDKFELIKVSGDFNDDLTDEDERILLVFKKRS